MPVQSRPLPWLRAMSNDLRVDPIYLLFKIKCMREVVHAYARDPLTLLPLTSSLFGNSIVRGPGQCVATTGMYTSGNCHPGGYSLDNMSREEMCTMRGLSAGRPLAE